MRFPCFLRASLLACALSVLSLAALSASASAQIPGFPGFPGSGCPQGQFGTPPNCAALPAPGAGCPDGQFGTPPNCAALPANCPAGQTGTPPNCSTPPAATCAAGQTGTPPNCSTPATCPAGQTGTPPGCRASGAATPAPAAAKPPPASRLVRRTVDLGRGCTRSLLSLTGVGASVAFAKRETPLRCRVTLRVFRGATGNRRLRVKRGQRTITLARLIPL